MSHVTFSPAAVADIDDVWDYTAGEWGADQADRYTDDIRDICHALARNEKRGRAVDVHSSCLKYATRRHFVFFRVTDTGIAVIRILHQSMDAGRYL